MRATLTPRDPDNFVAVIQMDYQELQLVTQAVDQLLTAIEETGDLDVLRVSRMAMMFQSYLSMAAP